MATAATCAARTRARAGWGTSRTTQLPGLYQGALALVMPSRHEGFGLPCIEAMAAGTPVVAADSGALPETCAEAALIVDVDDPSALLAATRSALHDQSVRRRLIEAGRRRARMFTWERTAKATDEMIGAPRWAPARPLTDGRGLQSYTRRMLSGRARAITLALGLIVVLALISGAAAAAGGGASAVPAGFVGVDVDGPLYPDTASRGQTSPRSSPMMERSGIESVRVVFSWATAQPYARWSQVPRARSR